MELVSSSTPALPARDLAGDRRQDLQSRWSRLTREGPAVDCAKFKRIKIAKVGSMTDARSRRSPCYVRHHSLWGIHQSMA
jgi:hypothetical protein